MAFARPGSLTSKSAGDLKTEAITTISEHTHTHNENKATHKTTHSNMTTDPQETFRRGGTRRRGGGLPDGPGFIIIFNSMYICMCMYVYMYIYIYVHIHMCIHIYIYIYVHIYRERERDRERDLYVYV